MATVLELLQALGSFVVGLVGRAGLFFAAGLVLAAPALVLALGWRAVSACRSVRGVRDAARFAPNHTWLAPRGRGEALVVGVDEIAQRIMPSATALELPTPGMEVRRGDPIAVVRAGRRAIRVGAPVDGTIIGVNKRAPEAAGRPVRRGVGRERAPAARALRGGAARDRRRRRRRARGARAGAPRRRRLAAPRGHLPERRLSRQRLSQP